QVGFIWKGHDIVVVRPVQQFGGEVEGMQWARPGYLRLQQPEAVFLDIPVPAATVQFYRLKSEGEREEEGEQAHQRSFLRFGSTRGTSITLSGMDHAALSTSIAASHSTSSNSSSLCKG